MLEELNMRRRYGDAYETYRRSAPFLFPVPRFVEKIFAAPFRFLFRKDRPERPREVVAVVVLYTVALMGLSILFYAGGLEVTRARLASRESRAATMLAHVARVRDEPNERRQFLQLRELLVYGDPAVEPLVGLVEGDDLRLRVLAAEILEELPSERALSALMAAARDPDENLRSRANAALGAIGSEEAAPTFVSLLDDPAMHIRLGALGNLAALKSEVVLDRAPEFLGSSDFWIRRGAVIALGELGSEEAIPLLADRLKDESAHVRRETVVSLLRTGSPHARPLLESVLSDEDFEVRVYAEEALKRLTTG